MNPIQVPSDGGRKISVLGIPMVIRIHGRDTGGIVSAVESHDVPGGGPPPHIHHREDETFQIIEETMSGLLAGKLLSPKKVRRFSRRAVCHTPTATLARRPAVSCASS